MTYSIKNDTAFYVEVVNRLTDSHVDSLIKRPGNGPVWWQDLSEGMISGIEPDLGFKELIRLARGSEHGNLVSDIMCDMVDVYDSNECGDSDSDRVSAVYFKTVDKVATHLAYSVLAELFVRGFSFDGFNEFVDKHDGSVTDLDEREQLVKNIIGLEAGIVENDREPIQV